jgi:ERCC4-related helicase
MRWIITPWVDDVIEEHGFNRDFFVVNSKKHEYWFSQSQKIIVQLRDKNIVLDAMTGVGKTVIALIIAITANKRTLFLVPNKSLAYEHEGLLMAMHPTLESKVITGELTFGNRDWHDSDEQIIFATGEVVMSEINSGNLNLDSFDFIVEDEVHHATDRSVYTKICQLAHQSAKQFWFLGMSATPGNKAESIASLWQNCFVDGFIKLSWQQPEVTSSVVYPEFADCQEDQNYLRAKQIIQDELHKSKERLSEQITKLPLGKPVQFDPIITFRREQINAMHKELGSLGQFQVQSKAHLAMVKEAKQVLWEYQFWAHVYELFLGESFDAIEAYYRNKFPHRKWGLGKKLFNDGHINLLIGLTRWQIHPKIEMLSKIAGSLVDRQMQTLVFVSNKATGYSCFKFLQAAGYKCDLVTSDLKRPMIQTVRDNFQSRQIQCLITTDVMREGYNLHADALINMTPSNNPIQKFQREGRVGRWGKVGEVINIVAEHERYLIPAIRRKALQLREINYDTGKIPQLPRRPKERPGQLNLF